MNYYEYCFTYTSSLDTEIINAVWIAELCETGFESFEETPGGLLGYIPENLRDPAKLEAKRKSFPLAGVAIHFTERYVEAKDWNEEWEKNYYQPTAIGDQCIVRASFHEVKPGYAYDIIINPKMSFGTGNHETTRLMLGEMLRLDLAGKAVLDMGCGTAVLAILAAMKGAASVTAVDIDEWAYRNALENIHLNHAAGIKVILGGAEQLPAAGAFDVIFANINRNILLRDIGRYALCMNPGASLFMSGFYVDDVPAIEQECLHCGLKMLPAAEQNRWVAVKAVNVRL
jgi:ribosomal protein L11 methyltransferase